MSRAKPIAVSALLAVAGLSCTSNPAPNGWLPTPLQAAADPWGAWIRLSLTDTFTIAGELLAVDGDTVFVLPEDGEVRRVPQSFVASARVAWFDPDVEEMGMWGFLGTLGSFSHGIGLVLSMPVWIISGTAAAASESRAPLLDSQRAGWDVLRRYARFPGGIPADLPARLKTRK